MSLRLKDMSTEPKSLQEAILYFSNPDNCIDYLAIRRWPDGKVVCPICGCESVSGFNPKRKTWKCAKHHPKREFSVKVGSLCEDSAIGLDKWLTAIWLLTNCKNGISSCEVASHLKVTQKTAWFMMHRIRLAMQDEAFGKLSGHVEVDETFIGGKARNMHLDKRERRITGTGGKDKTIVFGALERGGKIRTAVLIDRKRAALETAVKTHVEAGAALYSDALKSYDNLAVDYAHQVIDHAEKYVDGQVHTNGLENFWSLLKRGISGTYVSVEPFHLFRYLDEQMFRYNNRKDGDRVITPAERFSMAVSKLFGKRLTFAELTGKLATTTPF
jgi:transposase-like protein